MINCEIVMTTEEFNEFAPRHLTAIEIQQVREMRATLFQKWFEIKAGGKLELEFESEKNKIA